MLRRNARLKQGIIDPTGTKNFAKESMFEKFLQELKSRPCGVIKIVHWFFSYVCNRKFCCVLGALPRDNF